MDGMVDNHLKLFQGKKVLITGDTGFKGSWLSLWLHNLGAEVCGYALPPERDQDHYVLIDLGKLISHVDGDIRDLDTLLKVAKQFKPEFIFHLAAQSLVLRSYEEAKLTFDTNVGGSVNVLEVCRRVPSVKVLVYVTTDKCYLNREWIWGYRENDRLGGCDPYSASKAAAEIAFAAYQDSFFFQNQKFGATSVRAGNVIGGGDRSPKRLVPDSITALEVEQPVLIRNPAAVRPWQHVLEPLGGYLKLAAGLYQSPQEYSGSWNFGPGTDSMRQVEDLVKLIIEFWGCGEIALSDNDQRAEYEADLLYLNCDKAYHQLGWQPVWDFKTTVQKTVQWYKEVNQGAVPLEMTRQQIKDYTESLKRSRKKLFRGERQGND